MSDKDLKIPIRITIELPQAEWHARMRTILAHGDSGQLHSLIDKIPEQYRTRSVTVMKKATRYTDRYVSTEGLVYRTGFALSPSFIDVLDTIIRYIPPVQLFEELLSWGWSVSSRVELLTVADTGA